MRRAMTGDETGAMTAALRRVTLERDGARFLAERLKRQCKTLRQQLRREQADHQLTLKRLEALRGLLPEENGGC
jgi:hypothetical protein